MVQAVYLNIHFDLFSENELYKGKELLLQFGRDMMVSCTIETVMEMDGSVESWWVYFWCQQHSVLQQI